MTDRTDNGNEQQQYPYRINGTVDVLMTPARAAWYAERYDADVRPVSAAPLAPEGRLETGYSLLAERR